MRIVLFSSEDELKLFQIVLFIFVQPELSDADIRSGVHLTPEEVYVDVVNGSLIGEINFSQVKAKLSGVIHCIGKLFHLNSKFRRGLILDDRQNDLLTLEIMSRTGVINKIDVIQTSSKTNEIHFEQDNLLPGKYSGQIFFVFSVYWIYLLFYI